MDLIVTISVDASTITKTIVMCSNAAVASYTSNIPRNHIANFLRPLYDNPSLHDHINSKPGLHQPKRNPQNRSCRPTYCSRAVPFVLHNSAGVFESRPGNLPGGALEVRAIVAILVLGPLGRHL